MIDLHCHILPALDDGPQTLDQAIAMCRVAENDGVKTIVATPHYRSDIHDVSPHRIADVVQTLNREIRERGIAVTILAGAEIAISPEVVGLLTPGGDLTLNRSRYFLAEFSPLSVPPGWDVLLRNFLHAGLIPIIAHPERNIWFMNHPEALAAAVNTGIKIQITAMSLTGGFGPAVRRFCTRILQQDLVHVIASDGHSDSMRPPLLSRAVRQAASVVGLPQALAMVTTIPGAVIENRLFPEPIPKQSGIKRTKWIGWKRIRDLFGV